MAEAATRNQPECGIHCSIQRPGKVMAARRGHRCESDRKTFPAVSVVEHRTSAQETTRVYRNIEN
jgi:hypothetical protein